MSSAGPVLLGRVRCALDGPVKAAAGDVDVTDVPGSPSELDSPIRSRDQSQTWWIQRWTHRTFLCVAVIVAACLSGALAYALYDSSSYKSDSIFLVCFLIASNALAGAAAVLLWLIAPTQHLLLAARFLMLNWLGGLCSLFLLGFRPLVLVCELLGLQYLAQDRLKSIWPALNSPRWGACLGRAFWLEFALLSFLYLTPMIWVLDDNLVFIDVVAFTAQLLAALVFVMWVLGVATTLCRVVLMLRRTVQMARKEENSAAVQRLIACRRRSFWQGIGFLASLATTVILFKVSVSETIETLDDPGHYWGLHIPSFSFAVAQCINSVVNVAGVILLSKAYRLFRLPGSARPPPSHGLHPDLAAKCVPALTCAMTVTLTLA